MLNAHLFLAFVAASALMIVMPGPNVSLIVANGVAHGRRAAMLTVAGVAVGNALQMAVTVAGMASLALVFAQWFDWLRWLGVAYLVWLGIQAWRGAGDGEEKAPRPMRRHALLARGLLVALSNPKTWLFFAAFFPQFLDPALPPLPQLIVMSAVMLAIGVSFDTAYGLVSSRAAGFLRDPRRARLRGRVMGSFLIGAGLGLALARRT
jgi:threonine/homoserine/homoserine lactone efflux protein